MFRAVSGYGSLIRPDALFISGRVGAQKARQGAWRSTRATKVLKGNGDTIVSLDVDSRLLLGRG